jgi:hypothetical protein
MSEDPSRVSNPKGLENSHKKRKSDTGQTVGASTSPTLQTGSPTTTPQTQAEIASEAERLARHPNTHETRIPEEQRVALILKQVESAIDHTHKLSDYYTYPATLREAVQRLALIVGLEDDGTWGTGHYGAPGGAPNSTSINYEDDTLVTRGQIKDLLKEGFNDVLAQLKAHTGTDSGTQSKTSPNAATPTTSKATGPATSHATGPTYKPTKRTTTTSNNPTATTSTTKRDPRSAHHPSRLVVRCSVSPNRTKTELDLQRAINDRLCRNGTGDKEALYVAAVKFNQKGNIIIQVREDQLAKDLLARWDDIKDAFEGAGSIQPALDAEWHAVQVHGVNAGPRGSVHSVEAVATELEAGNIGLNLNNLAQPLRWMKRDIELLHQERSSVVIVFKSEDEAKALLKRGFVYAFGTSCTVTRHTNRAPDTQCRDCWSTEHTKPCKVIKCRLCAGGHPETTCPLSAAASGGDTIMATAEAPKLRCGNCEGPHAANDRKCPKIQEIHKQRQEKTQAKKKATTNTLTLSQETNINTAINRTTATLANGAQWKVVTPKKRGRRIQFAAEETNTTSSSPEDTGNEGHVEPGDSSSNSINIDDDSTKRP